jgi:hypothetical protein
MDPIPLSAIFYAIRNSGSMYETRFQKNIESLQREASISPPLPNPPKKERKKKKK